MRSIVSVELGALRKKVKSLRKDVAVISNVKSKFELPDELPKVDSNKVLLENEEMFVSTSKGNLEFRSKNVSRLCLHYICIYILILTALILPGKFSHSVPEQQVELYEEWERICRKYPVGLLRRNFPEYAFRLGNPMKVIKLFYTKSYVHLIIAYLLS